MRAQAVAGTFRGARVGARASGGRARDGLGLPDRRAARPSRGWSPRRRLRYAPPAAPSAAEPHPQLQRMNDEGPSVLTMIGAVALIVTLVILVFFAAGYGFGRLFLLNQPSVRTLAYFGIESSGLSLAVDLLILFVAVLYLSLIYWTYADARRRIVDPMLVGCATAASLFPFVGTIVYMILRPPEYLEDVRERELEMQAAEARLHELDHMLCPHCDYRVERDLIRCPSCLRKLKERCVSCSRPLDQAWAICPYCETEVPLTASRRPRRRRTR